MDILAMIGLFMAGVVLGYGWCAYQESRRRFHKIETDFDEFEREVRAAKERIKSGRFD